MGLVRSPPEDRRGVPDPGPARGRRRRSSAHGQGIEAASAARVAAHIRQRDRVLGPADRRALGRATASGCLERAPVPRLPAAEGARSRRPDRDSRARLPDPAGTGPARPPALRAAPRRRAERTKGARSTAPRRGPCPLARPRTRRPGPRAVRAGRDPPPRRAPPRRPRTSHRRRPRPRPPGRARRRTRGAHPAASVSRGASRTTHAGALRVGTPGRGARRLPRHETPARRRARDRPRPRDPAARTGDPATGPRAGLPSPGSGSRRHRPERARSDHRGGRGERRARRAARDRGTACARATARADHHPPPRKSRSDRSGHRRAGRDAKPPRGTRRVITRCRVHDAGTRCRGRVARDTVRRRTPAPCRR